MILLNELENMKYRHVLELIKNDEQYDKKRSVISAREVYDLCYKRYLLAEQILMPLKEKIGKEVNITDISLNSGMEEYISFLIKYIKNEKEYILVLSSLDYQDIEIVTSDDLISNREFIDDNRKIILNTFNDIMDSHLDNEIMISSTTKRYAINDTCNLFTIKDADIFLLENRKSDYKENALPYPIRIKCNYPKLKELLQDEKNRLAIYDHIKIYESTIPNLLTKKLTYR